MRKLTSLDELKEKTYGPIGTETRDKYEAELAVEIGKEANLNYQPATDYILVKAESRHETELKITGQNGQIISLAIDGEYEDDKIRCFGVVVAIPNSLSSTKRSSVACSDIVPIVQVGDKIYFDYLTLCDQNEVFENHYVLLYTDAICVVREDALFQKQIIPVGSHVLLNPVYPDDVVELEPGLYGRVNSIGLVTETNVPPLKGRGIIAHVAHPLKSEGVQMQAGQKAIVSPLYSGQWYTIEGNQYMICRQKDIEAIGRVNS